MKSVMYLTTKKAHLFRDNLYDPKSKASIAAMLQEVKDILIFEGVISDEISLFDWHSNRCMQTSIKNDRFSNKID